MKSVTEFSVFTLNRAQTQKNELATAGKTPEEIQQALGESFKYEGDKLKHFCNSLDLMTDQKDLKRIIVVTFGEGETVPGHVKKVDENHYMLDFFVAPRPPSPPPEAGKGGKGRNQRGGGGRGPGGKDKRDGGGAGSGRGPGGDRGAKPTADAAKPSQKN